MSILVSKIAYVLTQFKHLVKEKNMSINNAARIIAAKYVDEMFSDWTEIEQDEEDIPLLPFSNVIEKELQTEIEQLRGMNRMLLSRLDEQQKYIESRFNQQEELIKDSIKQSQEAQQLLLETTEKEQ